MRCVLLGFCFLYCFAQVRAQDCTSKVCTALFDHWAEQLQLSSDAKRDDVLVEIIENGFGVKQTQASRFLFFMAIAAVLGKNHIASDAEIDNEQLIGISEQVFASFARLTQESELSRAGGLEAKKTGKKKYIIAALIIMALLALSFGTYKLVTRNKKKIEKVSQLAQIAQEVVAVQTAVQGVVASVTEAAPAATPVPSKSQERVRPGFWECVGKVLISDMQTAAKVVGVVGPVAGAAYKIFRLVEEVPSAKDVDDVPFTVGGTNVQIIDRTTYEQMQQEALGTV